MLAEALIAVLLSFIAVELYRASRNNKLSKGDAILVDLFLGLSTTTAAVFWFCLYLRVFWQA